MLTDRERRRFTPEEYLLLEERAEIKSEYCAGEIFAMTGGSLNHSLGTCREASRRVVSLPWSARPAQHHPDQFTSSPGAISRGPPGR